MYHFHFKLGTFRFRPNTFREKMNISKSKQTLCNKLKTVCCLKKICAENSYTACHKKKYAVFLNKRGVCIPLTNVLDAFWSAPTKVRVNRLWKDCAMHRPPEHCNVHLIDSVKTIQLKLCSGKWWCISSAVVAFAAPRSKRISTAIALSFLETVAGHWTSVRRNLFATLSKFTDLLQWE